MTHDVSPDFERWHQTRFHSDVESDGQRWDDCGLSWFTLVSLFVVWFTFTFVVVFCVLLLWRS